MEKRWKYVGVAPRSDAEGRTCIFCSTMISGEDYPAHWVYEPEEDYADADFPLENGYAHMNCSRSREASHERKRFTLPDVPDLPQR